MTADDFTNMVEAEIEHRKHCCCIEVVELVQVCDCAYSEPDDLDCCSQCGQAYAEVRR